jgi:hypothetical protein
MKVIYEDVLLTKNMSLVKLFTTKKGSFRKFFC